MGAIVVVFVYWGVGRFPSQKAYRVALVNGEAVTFEEYREAYNNMIEQLRQQFGNNLNDDLIKMFRVESHVLNQLIDQRLILHEAKRLHLQVSDKELIDSIQKIEAFQSAGVFDNALYQRMLARNQLNPEEFESLQRKALLLGRMKSLVEDGIKVSDEEALEWYHLGNTAVDVDFVRFHPEKYEKIDIPDSEVQTYFENNKASYKTQPKVKVCYVEFDPRSYDSQVRISEEDITAYYNEHRKEFEKPKTVEVRHILFSVEQDADDREVEAARERALKIRNLAVSGQDFAELAKKYSDGPTKDSGGYLGTFKREDLLKPFADRAFSMKAGEISEPVRTQFGWHIIKVENVNAASALSQTAASAEIVKKLTAERSRTIAYDSAEALYDLTFDINDLVKAAAIQNLAVHTTGFFNSQDPPDGFREKPKFATVAFSLSEKEISAVLDLGNVYYIVQLLEKIPETIPEFNTVAEKVRSDLVKEKQREKAEQDAKAFLAALKDGKPLKSEAAHYGAKVESTGFFKRHEEIPGLGSESDINRLAFTLSAEKRFPDTIAADSNGFYVLIFKDVKVPEDTGFEKEKEALVHALLEQKRHKAFSDWLSSVRANSKIQLGESFQHL